MSCFYVGGSFTLPHRYAFTLTLAGTNYTPSPYLYTPTSPVTIIYYSPGDNQIYTAQDNSELYQDAIYLTKPSTGIVATAIIYNQKLLVATTELFRTRASPLYYISSIPTGSYTYDPLYITITSSEVVVFNNTEYKGKITLTNKGQSIELIWNASKSKWYIVGSNSIITIS